MRMVKALDAGPVLLQARTPVPADETYGELQLRLAEMGAMALIEALALIDIGQATETPQDDSLATYAGKVGRDQTRVDWTADASTVSRIIRAFDPRPGAFTQSSSGEVKLFGARLAPRTSEQPPGEVLSVDDEGLTVACGSGAVRVANVHPAGKRRIAPSSGRAGAASAWESDYFSWYARGGSGPSFARWGRRSKRRRRRTPRRCGHGCARRRGRNLRRPPGR
jgi:methionyl-tRNA formyltransferase